MEGNVTPNPKEMMNNKKKKNKKKRKGEEEMVDGGLTKSIHPSISSTFPREISWMDRIRLDWIGHPRTPDIGHRSFPRCDGSSCNGMHKMLAGEKKKPSMMGGARKENDADADDDVDDG